ncbi:hypothetical protein EW145_g3875 [Phellinidium pouzarii]|uniref:Uncharacterized protein n=1 Tax=Phellinidium pouzarii TaxID=167371 RepID=A0A4S4L628_9AGAM|nr:hypothetical protein EW145_g3875 [Phellinidium pouzarii]
MALPAHQTKHLSTLVYPFFDTTLTLSQSDDGDSNGTALWLGAQCLSVFLASVLPTFTSTPTSNPRRDSRTASAFPGAVTSLILKPVGTQIIIQVSRCTRSLTSAFAFVYINQYAPAIASNPFRAVELGSGVGLSALAMASLGWDILATDTPAVINAVLKPNITRNAHFLRGNVHVRALDWTVPPEEWTWTDSTCVASPSSSRSTSTSNSSSSVSASKVNPDNSAEDSNVEDSLLGPPFDLILTSDTVYAPNLVSPLLRTLRHLCLLSPSPSSKRKLRLKYSHAPLYLALEARDPEVISSFFAQARNLWGFSAVRIPLQRVRRAMARGGLGNWERSEWEGVEIWRMVLLNVDTETTVSYNS